MHGPWNLEVQYQLLKKLVFTAFFLLTSGLSQAIIFYNDTDKDYDVAFINETWEEPNRYWGGRWLVNSEGWQKCFARSSLQLPSASGTKVWLCLVKQGTSTCFIPANKPVFNLNRELVTVRVDGRGNQLYRAARSPNSPNSFEVTRFIYNSFQSIPELQFFECGAYGSGNYRLHY